MTTTARMLRRRSTEAEKRVWQTLRAHQAGAKFRRQQPIEGYVVDFVCFEHRLVIEIDGGQHGDADGYEQRRTRCLEANGFRILRFWNNDVMNIEGVFERIIAELDLPLPLGERKGSVAKRREGEGAREGKNASGDVMTERAEPAPSLSRRGRGGRSVSP
jgi:very-short-patch-repair endonuclease